MVVFFYVGKCSVKLSESQIKQILGVHRKANGVRWIAPDGAYDMG